MFENRKDLKSLTVSSLEYIHKQVAEILKGFKANRQAITPQVVNEELCKFWDKYWNDDIQASDLIKQYKDRLEGFKQEILLDLMNFCVVTPDVFPSIDDSNDWVTEEMKASRYYWKLCREQMASYLEEGSLDKIDIESECILRRLHDPRDNGSWNTKGLVLGNIQSGKTANYSALIAKAADAGYRLIIVLSGIHNDLRMQTQMRLEKEFIGYSQFYDKESQQIERETVGIGTFANYQEEKAPRCATIRDKDFDTPEVGVENLPWLFVVKKIPRILDRVSSWLQNNVPNKHNWPLLLIDDEADQASINTAKDHEQATKTNASIRSILKLFDRYSFVAYTATPFANIFINSSIEDKELGRDLFPKDFICRLEAPTNYFGPRDFFGNEFDTGLELYDYFEESSLTKWVSELENRATTDLPEDVERAILQFVLSTSIKSWRLTNRSISRPKTESSMLIHLSHKIINHRQLFDQFTEKISNLKEIYLSRESPAKRNIQKILSELLIRQSNIVTPEIKSLNRLTPLSMDWSLPESIDEIDSYIKETLESIEILMINGEAKQESVLSPINDDAYIHPIIFIGGNKLSRGLTLPGLCVSLFLRQTSMYDTLLQMGRWFGYRDGYIDLCRISTTPTIIERFRTICSACEDLNEQIDEMNEKNRTPENYRLAILRHPKMLITARNKMREALDAEFNFNSGTSSHLKMGMNQALIQKNTSAAIEFLEKVQRYGDLVYSSDKTNNPVSPTPQKLQIQKPAGRLWKNVPASVIINFLNEYQAEVGQQDVYQAGIKEYIQQMQTKGELTNWNVFVPGDPNLDPIFGSRFVKRTPHNKKEVQSVLELKALKTGNHEYIGVPDKWFDMAEKKATESSQHRRRFTYLREIAGSEDPKQAFFHLYLIDSLRHSSCSTGLIGQYNPVVSYYLWLPKSSQSTSMNFKTFNQTVQYYPEEEDIDSDEL